MGNNGEGPSIPRSVRLPLDLDAALVKEARGFHITLAAYIKQILWNRKK